MADVNRGLLRVVRDDRPPTAEALMKRVARGDEQAFDQLYDTISPMVFGIVVRVIKDRAVAEEVTQEALVEVWRLATRYDPTRGSLRAWVATIAHRKSVDRVRSEQARRDREDRDHASASTPMLDTVAEQLERAAEQEQIHEALETLTSKQREAVEMAYFEGRTYREVAVILDVPEGTVKTRIRDGLIKLRDGIGRL